MAHVGIERLAAGDAEEDAAEHQQPAPAAVGQEADGVPRIDGRQHRGMAHDAAQRPARAMTEPDQHDRPEGAADPGRAEPLGREQQRSGSRRPPAYVGLQGAGDDIDALQRAQHRDRRRDHPVAIDQRRAEQAHHGSTGPAAKPSRRPATSGQDAALAVVVGAHDDRQYLIET